jgi:hypothetical protein
VLPIATTGRQWAVLEARTENSHSTGLWLAAGG